MNVLLSVLVTCFQALVPVVWKSFMNVVAKKGSCAQVGRCLSSSPSCWPALWCSGAEPGLRTETAGQRDDTASVQEFNLEKWAHPLGGLNFRRTF